ncbi:beta-lactamase family protein [Gammaproteobacteria bacterium]|nr:beta-lactamase family protein [Gammaproteobacteria bacterium]
MILSNLLLAALPLLLAPLNINTSIKNFDSNHSLNNYLLDNNTSSFLVSEKGEIIIDEEFKIKNSLKPKSIAFTNLLQHGFVQNRSQEDVASIQKSFVSVLIGIAQQKGLIDINNPVSLYIGKWTQLEEKKEDLITVRNLLTMTSGLDASLNYLSDPGSEWFYNSRAYSYLIDVLEKSSGIQVNDLSSEWLFKELEMQETFWKERRKGVMGFPKDSSKYGLVTTAKDLLKFGEFILNGGEVGTNHIISDIDFFDDSFSKSQDLNEAYGYLWWLNNTTSFMTWDKDLSSGNLFPKAPEETILALGWGNRILAIIPSKEIVLVRLGSFPNDPNFNNNLWEYIQK